MNKKVKKKVVVKKVSPYPIDADLQREGVSFVAKILKVTSRGFFVDLGDEVLQLNSFLDARFTLPVYKEEIHVSGKVIKFLDQIQKHNQEELRKLKPGEKLPIKILRMAEIHFVGLTDRNRKMIERFCVAIGQAEK